MRFRLLTSLFVPDNTAMHWSLAWMFFHTFWTGKTGEPVFYLGMVPEQLCDVSFPVFVREDSGLSPQNWAELSGLVVGHLFQKTYIINHLPEDIAGFLAQGKPLRLIALEGSAPGHAVGLIAPWREPHTPVLEALLSEARRMV